MTGTKRVTFENDDDKPPASVSKPVMGKIPPPARLSPSSVAILTKNFYGIVKQNIHQQQQQQHENHVVNEPPLDTLNKEQVTPNKEQVPMTAYEKYMVIVQSSDLTERESALILAQQQKQQRLSDLHQTEVQKQLDLLKIKHQKQMDGLFIFHLEEYHKFKNELSQEQEQERKRKFMQQIQLEQERKKIAADPLAHFYKLAREEAMYRIHNRKQSQKNRIIYQIGGVTITDEFLSNRWNEFLTQYSDFMKANFSTALQFCIDNTYGDIANNLVKFYSNQLTPEQLISCVTVMGEFINKQKKAQYMFMHDGLTPVRASAAATTSLLSYSVSFSSDTDNSDTTTESDGIGLTALATTCTAELEKGGNNTTQ